MEKKLLALILMVAAGVRILHLVCIWNTPVLNVPIIDSEFYHAWASALAGGATQDPEIFFMSPLYPYILSILYRLVGTSAHAAAILQALAGLLLVYLVFRLGLRLFNEKAGLLAALLAALYQPFVYYEGVLLSAILILLLNAFALLLLLDESKKLYKDLLAGALLGLSALARPNVLLFVLMLAFAFVMLPSLGPRRRAAFLLLGVALVLLPVAYRNYRVGGEWVLTTAGLGMNFYAGNNSEAEGIYWEAPFLSSAEPQYENQDYRLEASRRAGQNLTIVAASHFWFLQGLDFVVRHPANYLRLLAKKFFLFFNGVEIPNNLSLYGVREFSPVLRLIPLSFGLLAPLGLVFWLLNLRRPGLNIAHIYGLSYLLATLLFFASSEYRLPLLLILLPFSAAGLMALWEHAKSGARDKAFRLGIFIILFALPINIPNRFTSSLASPRMDYFNLGSVLQKQDRHEEAATWLERALTEDPNFLEAHLALAQSYQALGMKDAAAEEYRRAGLPLPAKSSHPPPNQKLK